MTNEKISLTYEAVGAREFVQASKDSETALRRQARSLDETTLALQKEIFTLKGAVDPNKELIASKQRLLQQNKLLATETKQQIINLKQEVIVAAAAAKEQDNLAKATEKAAVAQKNQDAKKLTQDLKEQAAAAKQAAKEQEALSKAADKAAALQKTEASKQAAIAAKEQAAAAKQAAKESANAAKQASKEQILAAKQAEQQVKASAKAKANAEKQAAKEATEAAKKAALEQKKLTESFGTFGTFIKSLIGPLLAVFAVFEAGNIIKTADAFNQLEAKVKNSLSDVTEFDGVFQKLVDSSNRSGQSIDGVAQAFVRLRPAAENLGVTNDQLIKFNETFAKMGALAGATTTEVKNAMIQLSQSIASNRFSGDELRSVMEQMPPVARAIADSMGIPFEKFKKAAEQGKITAVEILKAILKKADETNAAFEKLPGSVDRSLNKLGNSFTLLIGAINKTTGATDKISKALSDMAAIVQKVSPGIVAVASEFFRLAGLVLEVSKAILIATADIVGLGGAMRGLLGIDGLSYFFNLAGGIDVVITRLQIATNEFARFKSHFQDGLLANPFNPGEIADKAHAVNAIADSANQTAEMQHRAREAQRVRAYQDSMSVKPRTSGGGGAIRTLSVDDKKKKGKSQATIDRQHIEDVTRNFQHQIEQAQASSALNISRMGPFPNQENVLQKQLLSEQTTAALLNRELVKLNNTSVKTADGQRALKEATAKVRDEISKQAKTVQDAKNALEKYNTEQKLQDADRERGLDSQLAEKIRDKEVLDTESNTQKVSEQYQQRKLKINEYYDSVLAGIEKEIDAETKLYNKKLELINQEIEDKKKLNNPQLIKDLEAQKETLANDYNANVYALKNKSQTTQRERIRDLTEAARTFQQELQGSIASAIKDAFSGNNPLTVIKNFAKNLYNIVSDTLSNAIAAGLAKSKPVMALSDWVGNWVNRISKNVAAPTASLPPLLPADVQSFSDLGGNTGQRVYPVQAGATKTQTTVNGSRFAGIGKILAPIAGAIGSYQVGKAAGNKFGKVGGALAGMGGGMAIGALAGSVLGPVGAILGAAIGGTIGGIAGMMGGGKAKKQAARAAYQDNILSPYLNTLVSGADQNNLTDLYKRVEQASRGMKGNGSRGMQMKRDAMNELKKLIEQRKKAIADFIKDISHQNDQLRDEIALADAKPFEKAGLERQIAIKQIEYDTKLLLDQYKDSEQAKTAILEQESLKRQQLGQKEVEDFKSTTQDLRDLLIQRDDAANANVFTRLRSPEQVKAENLSKLDQQIAQKALELRGKLAAGISGDSLGSKQLLGGIGQFLQTNQLQFIISGVDDPNAVSEEVARQLESFFRKFQGANLL